MLLEIEGLSKSFKEKQVLKEINFTFDTGHIYGLLGRNGAGKTTLFNCLSKYTNADSGKILLKNPADPASTGEYKESDIGFVFTQPHLPEFMTGEEFIRFFCEINEDKIQDIRTPEEYMHMVAFDPNDGKRLIKEYSHGMMNKLQMLVSLFMLRPPVILLDEPLTSFDVVAALEVKNMIKSIRNNHIIIFSTHILQLAQDLCDEIVVLSDGKLRHVPNEMIHSPEFEAEIIEILRDSLDSTGEQTRR